MSSAAPLLLHVFPGFAVGGAQLRTCQLINHFGTALRHAILATDDDTSCRVRLRPGLLIDYLTVPINKGDLLGNLLRFRRVLRDLGPDLLLTYNWGAIEWAMANRLVGLRHVHIEDGFGPEERDRQLPRRVWTRRLVLRRSTVVVPSRTLEHIAHAIWRLPRRQLRYIPNGVDLDRFSPRTAETAAAETAAAVPVIGTVAALRPEKNLARLLRAFAALRAGRPARLLIAGDGPDRSALQQLAVQLGIAADVSFLGHRPDPREAYRQTDIFAISSDTEQMPLALLEAMACGLPVAGTDVGDVKTMVSPPNAHLIVPPDDAALTQALITLLDAPALRARLGAANRARAEAEFDQHRMHAAYRQLMLPDDV